ncbi:Endonuclease III-like protein 1 [Armadillidium vulgare]|nr:Endonuclease III-like protein 1 [Armadillidium vulgare]
MRVSDYMVRRFHTLIGLMLSSQTKDAVTHAAVMRLREHGLTVENILNTPVDRLKSLIYPVGFYKVSPHISISPHFTKLRTIHNPYFI